MFDPFAGDQALFLVGAERLHEGGALYRDFWDLKQPGIYDFFLIGGALFGFDQTGEHVADLLWQLSFCFALIVALRSATRLRASALFAPIAVVGAYYAGSSSWHLMQVEGLIGFPLFCCAWATICATRAHRFRGALFFAVGVSAGIVALFKALLVVVAVAIVGTIVLSARPASVAIRRSAFGWACAGAGTVGLIVALTMIANGTLVSALTTTFVTPYQIVLSVSHAPFARLYDSAMRLVLYYRGTIVLAVIGLCARRDAASRPWRLACVAWLLAGSSAILAQVESWWQYHMLLLVPPLGILATFGFDFLFERVLAGRWKTVVGLAASGVVAYVAVPLPQGAIGTVLRVLREKPYASSAALENYRATTNSEYDVSRSDALALSRSTSASGPIYVFGEPLIYVIAGRDQAIPMNGWAPQIDTPFLWQRTYEELDRIRPNDIFVNVGFERYLALAADGRIGALLRRDYVMRVRTADGLWYSRSSARRGPSPGAPPP